ncbi:MAG: type II 3-dehydroquinate dehydratase [Flavobacteriales bacterium]|nr:type II 3-dehydroquinate dehydratase [Flavobacteriales bacterium]
MSKRLALIHGPNLNLLGQRDPGMYGTLTLAELEAAVRDLASARGFELSTFQSNVEGELINALHDAAQSCAGVIFNPGGFSHTSVALRDAVEAIGIPTIEVHLSNIHARESFRRTSLTASAAKACISGLGKTGYLAAVDQFSQLD